VAWLGTSNLFLVAAMAMAATLGLLTYLVHANATQMAESAQQTAASGAAKAAESPLKNPYIRLIISAFVLFIIAIYFVDNIFYSQAEIQYPNKDALASFIGLFFGVFGVLSLLVQIFVAGRVLSRFGVQVMILATPTGLLVISLLLALTGTLTSWQVALFWLAAASNMYRLILDAADASTINLLFQPLPDRQRAQAQTLVLGVTYPLAIGLTGLILLFLINVLHFGPVQLVYVLLLIIG
jgi:ATP/ADP translocase